MVLSIFVLGACRDSIVEDDAFIKQIANGIPVVEIYTIGVNTITSSKDYAKANIKIRDCDDIIVEVGGKIRGRGNATWTDYPKKPYKIKLDEAIGLLGFPPNRDWVLLAEYCDKSLLRTAYMCEVSRAVGIDYTVNYQHVDLMLNGEYVGTYMFTELIERDSNRINIDDDGYIIEDDFYYEKESVFIKTNAGCTYTFKFPEAKDIANNDERYAYIGTFLTKMEETLKLIPQDCKTYKNYIDIKSFATWYVAAEVTGNWDPNLYYVLPSRNERLKMMPLWDAEWSLGLASQGNPADPIGWFWPPSPPPSPNVNIWNNRKYFVYLFKDEDFVSEVRKVWSNFQQHIPEVKRKISSRKDEIRYAQKCNFERWPILNDYVAVGLVALGSWEAEVEYTNNYFDRRVQWFDTYLSGFGTPPRLNSEESI